jgi:hypothetical protein
MRKDKRHTLVKTSESEANKKLPFEAPTTGPVTPTIEPGSGHEKRRLLMGHGNLCVYVESD